MLEQKAIIPHLETRPYVGFRPVMPHNAAGCLIEPPVSVPVANEVISAATHAAEPPELPPGTNDSPQGLMTGPKKLVSLDEPIANSSIFVLPIIIDPA